MVNTEEIRIVYTASGGAAFAFNFKVLDSAHVVVQLDAAVKVGGYTVTLNADQDVSPGGTVTFTAAPPANTRVEIRRRVPLTQETTFNPYTSFPAKTVEQTFDKLAMEAQQVADGLAMVVKEAWSQEEEDALFAAGAIFVLRMDLLVVT